MLKEKIGLIGVGNMGTAILEGLFKKKIAKPAQVWVYDKFPEKVSAFTKHWKVHPASSSLDVVKNSKILLLAVKPQDLEEASTAFKPFLRSNHVIISILAGTPIAKIKKIVGSGTKIVRAMPNLGAKVGEAMTALTGDHGQAMKLAERIFSGCGKTLRLDEKHFDLVTAVSGSGPAYFFHLMELLEEVGIANGLSKTAARLLAIQTAVGGSLLAQSAKESPAELRAMVTSKGGTTAAALNVMEKENFAETFRKAVHAARDRSREMSR